MTAFIPPLPSSLPKELLTMDQAIEFMNKPNFSNEYLRSKFSLFEWRQCTNCAERIKFIHNFILNHDLTLMFTTNSRDIFDELLNFYYYVLWYYAEKQLRDWMSINSDKCTAISMFNWVTMIVSDLDQPTRTKIIYDTSFIAHGRWDSNNRRIILDKLGEYVAKENMAPRNVVDVMLAIGALTIRHLEYTHEPIPAATTPVQIS
jgi:hypothetical protein